MESIKAYYAVAAVFAALMGWVFKIGVDYFESNKFLPWKKSVFVFFFSFGAAAFTALYLMEKTWSMVIKLIIICASSFFGSVIITGLGSIKGEFFAELFKDFLRKKLNAETTTNNNGNEISEPGGEDEISEEVPQTEEDGNSGEQ